MSNTKQSRKVRETEEDVSDLCLIYNELSDSLRSFIPGEPVAMTYNPLEYAYDSAKQYMDRYGDRKEERILLVGMNPGPWGMAQTGIPFGDVVFVRDWMGIEGFVGKPKEEHPARPIEGFECERREVSGSRLWGWAKERYKDPETFFNRYFVWNYCPLCFMTETGANYTPNKLSKEERERCFAPCDTALRALYERLSFSHIIGIGNFAEKRIKSIFKEEVKKKKLKVGKVLHPSPASPLANRGWAEAAEKQLTVQGALAPIE